MAKNDLAGLKARLIARSLNFKTTSDVFKRLLLKIGLITRNNIILNIRKNRIIDTGRLLNSIQFRVNQPDDTSANIEVGSYGVIYAAIHEFGGPFTPSMRRAMFASLHRRFGDKIPERNKGIVSGGRLRARPYLRPGLQQSRNAIYKALRDFIRAQ